MLYMEHLLCRADDQLTFLPMYCLENLAAIFARPMYSISTRFHFYHSYDQFCDDLMTLVRSPLD